MNPFNTPSKSNQNPFAPLKGAPPQSATTAPDEAPEESGESLLPLYVEVEELPGDRLRLKPVKTTKPLFCALILSATWIFGGLVMWRTAHPQSSKEALDGTGGVFFLSVGMIVVSMLFLWEGWGHEDWVVGPNRAELHRRIFFLRWGGHYKNAALIVQLLPTGRSSSDYYLCIKKKRLFGSNRALIREEGRGIVGLHALARLVAARTGWPLELPDFLQKLDVSGSEAGTIEGQKP